MTVQFHLGQGAEGFIVHEVQIYGFDRPLFISNPKQTTGITGRHPS